MTNQTPARERLGAHGVAERFGVPMKPGNAGGGKGPQFKTDATRGEGPGDWATYQLRTAFRNCRRRCTRKRRQNPATASTPSTTRSAATTFWRTPMPSAAPTRARRAWTVRTSRRSKRMGSSDGWANWRLRSGRRLTDRTLQTRVHTEGQGQAQAAGHLNLAGSGLHDGSDAGAGADLRSRASTGTLRLPSWAKRPTGGGQGAGAGVSRPSGRGGRRPRGLLREHSPCRPAQIGCASDRRSARAASDQDVAGLPRGRNRRSGSEDAHDRGAGQAARHSAGLADLTLAGESLHAPVRAGMEDVRARANPRHAARDLRRRPRDPVQTGQGRSGPAKPARDHGQAEADGERGEDAHLQSAGGRVRLSGLHVRTDVLGEDRPSPYRPPAIKEEHSARGRESSRADRPMGNMARDHDAGG